MASQATNARWNCQSLLPGWLTAQVRGESGKRVQPNPMASKVDPGESAGTRRSLGKSGGTHGKPGAVERGSAGVLRDGNNRYDRQRAAAPAQRRAGGSGARGALTYRRRRPRRGPDVAAAYHSLGVVRMGVRICRIVGTGGVLAVALAGSAMTGCTANGAGIDAGPLLNARGQPRSLALDSSRQRRLSRRDPAGPAWYEDRNDALPAVYTGIQRLTIEQSVTRTIDRQHHHRGRVFDHFSSTSYRDRVSRIER